MDCYHNSQQKASLFDLYQLVVCEHSGFVFVHNKKIMISYSTSGAELTKRAFAQIPIVVGGFNLGSIMLSIAIFTFAFSTILGWSYYGEKALEYLCGTHYRIGKIVFRVLFIIVTFGGAIWTVQVGWAFGALANALMALPNLVCLLCLSGVLVSETRKYLWEGRLDDESEESSD